MGKQKSHNTELGVALLLLILLTLGYFIATGELDVGGWGGGGGPVGGGPAGDATSTTEAGEAGGEGGTTTTSATTTTTVPCVDTDGGADVFVYGYCDDGNTALEDQCSNPTMILEADCVDGTCTQVIVVCPDQYECSDKYHACIPTGGQP